MVSDPAELATWFARVERWQPLGEHPTGLGARWDMKLGIGAAPIGGIVEVVEFDPDRDIAWNSVTGVSMRGRIRLRGQDPERTLVTLRVSYQSPGGLVGLLADRVASPIVARVLRESLRNLAGRFDV